MMEIATHNSALARVTSRWVGGKVGRSSRRAVCTRSFICEIFHFSARLIPEAPSPLSSIPSILSSFHKHFFHSLFSLVYVCEFLLQVPERVRAMNATIKLLLIVREPVTRAISDYTQLRSHAATAVLPQQSPPPSASSSSPSLAAPSQSLPTTSPVSSASKYEFFSLLFCIVLHPNRMHEEFQFHPVRFA